jgi:hypothetical protein
MSKYVLIYPGSPIIEIPDDSKEVKVLVRNVSEVKLTKLRLEVKSAVVTTTVSPKMIDELIPADRKSFSMKILRKSKKDRQRYPFDLTLYAQGLPVPAGLDLMVDMGLAMDKGWINVGQVKLLTKKQSKLVYYLLAGTPMVLLLGWLAWRASRPKSRKHRSKKKKR